MKKVLQGALQGKVVTVVGASGYLGSNICKYAAQHGATVNGISRRGFPPGQLQSWQREINWIRGDAMEANQFSKTLNESDLIVHTVGTLIDSSILKFQKPGTLGTYEQMNRDTLINVAQQIEGNLKPSLVYISASRAPPFIHRYLSTKLEAEQYLLQQHNSNKLRVTIVRPSFIVSWSERWWSKPLQYEIELYRIFHGLCQKIVPSLSFAGNILKELEVDRPIQLEYVMEACLLNLKYDKNEGKILELDDIELAALDFRQYI